MSKKSSHSRLGIGMALLFLLFYAAAAKGSEHEPDIRQTRIDFQASGVLQFSSEGFLEERLVISESVSAILLNSAVGDSVRLDHWPVAPGDRKTVTLTPVEVYARNARIFEIGEQGVREVPRSSHRHFVGRIEGETRSGVLLILDQAGGSMAGLTMKGGLTYDLEPLSGGGRSEFRVVSADENVADFDPHWGCGEEDLVDQPVPMQPEVPTTKVATMKSSGPLEAVIAIDTDTELLSQKFGGNTTAATDYIADLIAAMNVMYSRDLNVTLVQGTTFLRTSSDPYSANSGGSASLSELDEFGDYWRGTYGSVQRTVAAMLSGKSTSSNYASGIAWLGGLCSTGTGYSFSKVFKINYLSGDASLVGHELGHNFGSHHTHCYSPKIDECWDECGLTGPTSCPGGPGTVMSYCHLIGCGRTFEFHSRVVDNILNNNVVPATGVCIFPALSSDSLFLDGFEGGGINAWSSSSQ